MTRVKEKEYHLPEGMEWKEYTERVQAFAALPSAEVVDHKLARDEWAREVGQLVLTTYEAGKEVRGRERAELWYRSFVAFVKQIMSPELPIPEFHRWWYWWLIRISFRFLR